MKNNLLEIEWAKQSLIANTKNFKMKKINQIAILLIISSLIYLPSLSSQIYSADFSIEGDGFPDHFTPSNPPASAPASASGGSSPNNWTVSYSTTPLSDGSANEFSVNATNEIRIQDWGGPGSWRSTTIDVSSYTTISISASGQTVGNGANSTGEFFSYLYILDGGAPVITNAGNPGSYSVVNLNVASATTLVVGFNFNVNGANDGFEISDFQVFNTPLPIELKDFNAYIDAKQSNLDWQTASELNNSHFSIEKSQDGLSFREIGIVNGNGTTNETQNYEFIDKTPFSGTNYYRLKQFDFDGKFEYSKVVSIWFGKEGTTQLYPTIAKDEVMIKLNEPAEENGQVLVFDLNGRLVTAMEFETETSEIPITISDLQDGQYILKLAAGHQSETFRFFKK
jgi:Secretion system C-terminal sorting domain